MNIEDLIDTDKMTNGSWFSWPDHPTFRVLIAPMSQSQVRDIIHRHTKTQPNPRTGAPMEITDTEAANKDIVMASVQAWDGLNLAALRTLAPVPIKAIKKSEGASEDLDFNEKNVTWLIQWSKGFFQWIQQMATNPVAYGSKQLNEDQSAKNS